MLFYINIKLRCRKLTTSNYYFIFIILIKLICNSYNLQFYSCFYCNFQFWTYITTFASFAIKDLTLYISIITMYKQYIRLIMCQYIISVCSISCREITSVTLRTFSIHVGFKRDLDPNIELFLFE